MYNCFADRNVIKNEVIDAIMSKFECLLDGLTEDNSANYWIDNRHNVYAFINDNGSGDRWIEIHYELCNCNEDIIGDDLFVLCTDDVTREDLLKEVRVIVDTYYGD